MSLSIVVNRSPLVTGMVSPVEVMGSGRPGLTLQLSTPKTESFPLKTVFNPYRQLIDSANNDPASIRQAYAEHRLKRNAIQKELLLKEGASGIVIDHILSQLISRVSGFVDKRNNISILARPPLHIHQLIDEIQTKLLSVAPNLWLAPTHLRHVTVLEVAHTKTPQEIQNTLRRLRTHLERLIVYPCSHMVRLDRPLLGFDGAAVALTFLPAVDDARKTSSSPQEPEWLNSPHGYTYHHLRRDMYDLCSESGVIPESRYTSPSAHITLARFVSLDDFSPAGAPNDDSGLDRMQAWLQTIEDINSWLMDEYWSPSDRSTSEWIIGKDAVLDCRTGTNWYGAGDPALPEYESLSGRIWDQSHILSAAFGSQEHLDPGIVQM